MNRQRVMRSVLCGVLLLLGPGSAIAQSDPLEQLRQLDGYTHAVQVAFSEADVIDHEIGLGAMQKRRGAWRFKTSERFSGRLTRYTWQITDGFTSREVMEELVNRVAEGGSSELLFECEGRACGNGAEWANRVFGQRVLYGRDDLQRYRVYALHRDVEYRLVIYSSARTADRQYLQVDLLRIPGA